MPSMNVSLTSELMAADAKLLCHHTLDQLKEALAEGVRQATTGDVEPFDLNSLITEPDGRV